MFCCPLAWTGRSRREATSYVAQRFTNASSMSSHACILARWFEERDPRRSSVDVASAGVQLHSRRAGGLADVASAAALLRLGATAVMRRGRQGAEQARECESSVAKSSRVRLCLGPWRGSSIGAGGNSIGRGRRILQPCKWSLRRGTLMCQPGSAP